MKSKNIWKKIRHYLSYGVRLLGMFAGLALVPAFWNIALERTHFYFLIYSVICLIFLIMYYHSFIRLKVVYNDKIYSSFQENLNEESTKREYFSFLFKQKIFWIQYAVTALMFILIPLRLTAPVVAWVFGAYGDFAKELLALCVFIPFLFVVYVLAHISAIEYWQQERGTKRDVTKKVKRNTYISIMAAYAIVPFAVLMIIEFLRYIPLVIELWEKYPSPLLLVLVIFVILFAIFFNLFRVLCARKKCIKRIKQTSQKMGFEMSTIKHPYLSAFRVCKGESFQIDVRGKTYSCKLVGAPHRGRPLVIHPAGALHFLHAIRLFKTTLFSHATVREFGYDSEYSKILIINPVPKELSCHFGNKIEAIDNGAIVGGYKIYTATAFVRAIETDTVERL